VVGEEQAIAVVVGAKAVAAASRSVRTTALMVGVEEAGGEHRCRAPDQVPDRRGRHRGRCLAAWSHLHGSIAGLQDLEEEEKDQRGGG
jgi:hypothetical protein